jgi:hypothetical protein
MIFLGAGASKFLGIPTLQEFSEDVIKELRGLGHKELIEDISRSLSEFNLKIDFEALYTIIEALIDPYESVRTSGPLTAYLVKNKSLLPHNYDFKEMLGILRDIIYKKCNIRQNKVPKIIDT